MLATLQHYKDLCVAHGAEEAKRSCVFVPETRNVQEEQKQETEANESEEDYPPSPGTTGKYRFSCKHTDAFDTQGNSFPFIVLK